MLYSEQISRVRIDMASREEIGKEIRLARKALGYTQKNLSEKTNVNKTTISEIENCNGQVKSDNAIERL